MSVSTKLVFATHNPNKVGEVRALMPKHITLYSLTEMGITDEIPETGTTLEQNARLKSTFIFKNHGVNCFADDTGLLVDALGGAPGVYSARYAGNEKNAEANMDKLLHALDGKNNRSARFETVVSLFWKGEHYYFKGLVRGQITFKKMGVMGFGYDPIFQPDGHDGTFAQLPLEVKNKIGHRGKAMAKLIGFLRYKG